MKIIKKMRWGLLLLVMLGTLLEGGEAHAYEEMIVNGSFETGDLTGWTPVGPAFDGGVTSEHADFGTYCLQLGSVDFIEQTFSPAVNSTYVLRFWAFTETSAGAANVRIEYADATGESLLFGGNALAPGGEWKQFIVPVDHTKHVSRLEFSTWETVPIFLDDISFCGEPLLKPEVTEPETITETQLSTETTSALVTMTVPEKKERIPIPGFMVLPALLGLIVLGVILRKRRTWLNHTRPDQNNPK